MKNIHKTLIIIASVIALFVVLQPLYVIDEGEQVTITAIIADQLHALPPDIMKDIFIKLAGDRCQFCGALPFYYGVVAPEKKVAAGGAN